MTEKNARITATSLGNEDHGIFTAYIVLDYGGAGQSFGGYALDQWSEPMHRRIGTAYGCEFIKEILRVLEVREWEKLPGTFCRVRAHHSGVEEIGHPLKDHWFNPNTLAEKFK